MTLCNVLSQARKWVHVPFETKYHESFRDPDQVGFVSFVSRLVHPVETLTVDSYCWWVIIFCASLRSALPSELFSFFFILPSFIGFHQLCLPSSYFQIYLYILYINYTSAYFKWPTTSSSSTTSKFVCWILMRQKVLRHLHNCFLYSWDAQSICL